MGWAVDGKIVTKVDSGNTTINTTNRSINRIDNSVDYESHGLDTDLEHLQYLQQTLNKQRQATQAQGMKILEMQMQNK
ncbi:FlxA-like protein [Caenorhabditis elegans]|uniref:FlxA-like protein n=1 Tax=Caenorhabditis elegans TaxID=6239 RepID=Q564U7_CAEEL|nr:FlxA-like protein [Caenorhabditis elegans]CAI79124.1 FlxA-like protein [Caenorhabditis elegans]|eukprot:NP_001023777.1 Uncharacterized protein CELE_F09C6.13 [Caenorhabditis elegans]